MKLTAIILTAFFYNIFGLLTESKERLNILLTEKKITKEQFDIFSKQLEFRSKIDLQTRLDSMDIWGLDILYTEEFYYPKKDSFFVKEYYFSSTKEKEVEKNESIRGKISYQPEKYYENGVEHFANFTKYCEKGVEYFRERKYFIEHEKGKEQLASIREHMQDRKLIDKIDPLIKKDFETAGCSVYSQWTKKKKKEKEYTKPQKPDYYLIETFLEKREFKVSFQIPIKTKHRVIVEYHSF
jgi:hypothetical protein